MFTISTGEPPTRPVTTSQRSQVPATSEPKTSSIGLEDSGRVPSDFEDSGRVPSDFEDSGRVSSSGIETAVRTRSDLEDSGRIPSDFEDSGRMPQEPDSGYEASPCSITDTCPDSLHFFGDEERPDDVFEDFVLLGSEEDEDCVDCGPNCRCNESSSAAETVLDGDLSNCADCGPNCRCNSSSSANCADCGGANCRCTSNSRPESSSAAETVLDGDLSNCDSSDSSAHHPSSLPIRIPRATSNRTRPAAQDMGPSYGPAVFPFHPRSCPAAWLGQSSPLTRMTSEAEWQRRRASLQNQRRRRLQIDSDASSDVDSSDDNFLDGLDNEDNEVFPMASEAEDTSDHGRLVPLPDIVLHSSSSSSSSSSVRRSRSVSVNLPPQPEVLQDIGRSLRRLSDEFQSRREAGQTRRRQTITSFDRYYRAS